jgi:hypothetical protein
VSIVLIGKSRLRVLGYLTNWSLLTMTMDANDLGPDDMDGLMDDLANDYLDLAKCIGFTGTETHEEIKARCVMLWEQYKLGVKNA